MSLKLVKAERKKTKLKLAIAAPSGGGKTYSALLMAYGLCGDWEKIAVIDTENESASLYTHLGQYNTIVLPPPFTPERYIEAIEACVEAKMEVIIIDSMSHEWEAEGGALDAQNQLGGRYQDWAKVTPRHTRFINAILQAPCHVIGTMRRKTDYDMTKEGNKTIVTKVGLKQVQREGTEYEFTILFALEQNHLAKAEKDRTGLFDKQPEFVITAETGKKLREWCEQGIEAPKPQQKVYDGSTAQQTKMLETLKGQGIDEKYHLEIHEKMLGKPAKEFNKVIAEVLGEE